MLHVAITILLAGPAQEAAQQAAAPATWTKEPDGYRGVTWGATPGDAANALKTKPTMFMGCTCTATDGKSGSCSPKTETDERRVPVERACMAYSMVGFTQVTERWIFDHDHLAAVRWTFPSARGYVELRGVLVEKYGPPTATETTPGKTGGGHDITNETLTWTGATVTVEASRYSSTIADGFASFETNKYREAQRRAFVEKERAAARSF